MATHVVGRDSKILKEIRSGRKTVEARLAKPRFRRFRVGDQIRIREDFWEGGQILKSRQSSVRTYVTKTERFPSFVEMFKIVDYHKVDPGARNLDEALLTARRFYTSEQEAKYGVLAIHFRLAEKKS